MLVSSLDFSVCWLPSSIHPWPFLRQTLTSQALTLLPILGQPCHALPTCKGGAPQQGAPTPARRGRGSFH